MGDWVVILVSVAVGYVLGRVRPLRVQTDSKRLIRSVDQLIKGES